MNTEEKALTFAGVVWLLFMIVGVIQKPIKMSGTVAVGGGFIVACISAIVALFAFQSGILGVGVLIFGLWLGALAVRVVFGR